MAKMTLDQIKSVHREYMRQVGLAGGLIVKQKKLAEDPDYYRRIGRKGGLTKGANFRAKHQIKDSA